MSDDLQEDGQTEPRRGKVMNKGEKQKFKDPLMNIVGEETDDADGELESLDLDASCKSDASMSRSSSLNVNLSGYDDNDAETHDMSITVDDPEKHSGTMDSYVTFRITLKTTRTEFVCPEYEVRRRYNDFLWLRQKLEETYPTHVVPPMPEKHSLRRLDRFSPEFLRIRALALQKFVNRVADHPVQSFDKNFHIFLTAKAWEFQSHKKQSTGLLGRVSDSLYNMGSSYMLKYRKPEFAAIQDYILAFGEKLANIERITQRIVKEQTDFHTDLLEWGPIYTLWSNSEDQLVSSLHSMTKAVETSSASLKELQSSSPDCENVQYNGQQSSSPDCETSSSPDCKISSSPDCEISSSPDCEISSSPDCEISSSPDCEISSSPDCEISSSPNCEISSSPDCEISSSPDCEISSSPDCEISSSPDCEISSSPDCEISSSPDCEISSSPDCEISSSPDCEISSSPDGEISSSPDCEISSSPDCEISSSPDCEISSSPDCEISSSPDCEISSSPDCEISSSPDCEISSSPDCEISSSPDCEISSSPDCENVQTIDATEDHFNQPLREYILYTECIKTVLRRRDAIQAQYEQTLDELNKRKEERDQLKISDQTYSLGAFLGKDPDEVKQNKQDKLEQQVKELTTQMEVLNDKSAVCDTDLRADMERWQKNKHRDMKELFMEAADRNVRYYETCLKAWEDTIHSIQGKDFPVTACDKPEREDDKDKDDDILLEKAESTETDKTASDLS
ncbi:hypothetical protein DPMN_090931 [Dreissena polymorpha]|uniref:PX domain-containing protein n=1 Tax=Dreissena polymorpha TaxID=45954 RepID=A0A9D4KZN1_DREPO|nr:hypothetical protein DPMN_090931 [Dreissena polymorpha]